MAMSLTASQWEPEIEAAVEKKQNTDLQVDFINGKLKDIKQHLLAENDYIPDIRSFLSAHDYIWSALVGTPGFFQALDATICFIIRTMKEKLNPEDFRRRILTENTADKSLMMMVMELTLVDSCALLLSYGAAQDFNGTHAEKIIEMLHKFMWEHSFRISRSKEVADIQELLDFRAFCASQTKPYFATAITQGVTLENFAFMHGKHDELPDNDGFEHLEWIHVPSTNGLAIRAILQAVLPEFVPVFRDHFSLSTVAPGDPLLAYREVMYWSDSVEDIKPANCTAIIFPCLRLTTTGKHRSNRREYEHLRESLSTRVSGAYSSKCTIHLERTLDEAYYPGVDAALLEARNNDQIVSSVAKSDTTIAEGSLPILIVPQLWLWKFDNIVVSAYSFTQDSDCFKLHKRTIGGEKFFVWSRQHPFPYFDLDIEMGRIMVNCIDAFGVEATPGETKYAPTLDLFESRVVAVLADVKSYMENGKRNDIKYDEERNFHHTLSDVRGELVMIQHILRQQKTVIDGLLGDRDQTRLKQDKEYAAGWAPVEEALITLERYQKWTRKIDIDAERIEKNVQDMLNLKRTYASVQDSHASVLLSVAAIGFTIVTIIFAPLAFLTALFALNLQGFDKLRVKQSAGEDGTSVNVIRGATENQDFTINVDVSNNDAAYDGRKIAGIFIGTEVLTIAVTCVLVWASLRWFRIDFRMSRDKKPRDKKMRTGPSRTKGGDAKEREKNANVNGNENTRENSTKRWLSSFTRRNNTAQSNKGGVGV